MKKIILTILALATIVALTVIPASAYSYDKYDVDESGKTWIQLRDYDASKDFYIMVEIPADDAGDKKIGITALTKSVNDWTDNMFIEAYEKELGFTSIERMYCVVGIENNKTYDMYIEVTDKNLLYTIDMEKFYEDVENVDEETEGIVPALIKETNTVTLKAPDGKNHTFYKVSLYNDAYLFFTPDEVQEVAPVTGTMATAEKSNTALIVVMIAEAIAIIALAVALITKTKKPETKAND